MTNRPEPISKDERKGRIERLPAAMQGAGADAVLLGSTTSLAYFTRLVWHQSERLVGALVTTDSLTYIAPSMKTVTSSMPCCKAEGARQQRFV